MKAKYPLHRGFTLIELLVVMTIIAVLATVGFTAFGKAREMANKTAATSNLKQIHIALTGYATDNSDKFPDQIGDFTGDTEATSSNMAFRKLIPSYINDEKSFAVRGTPSGAKVDGDVEGAAELEPEECHYALGAKLLVSSNGSYPLVWEAGNSGDDTYNPSWKKGERDTWGGSWSDGSVLICTVSGGVSNEKLDLPADAAEGDTGTIQKKGKASKNIFEQRSNGTGLAPEK